MSIGHECFVSRSVVELDISIATWAQTLQQHTSHSSHRKVRCMVQGSGSRLRLSWARSRSTRTTASALLPSPNWCTRGTGRKCPKGACARPCCVWRRNRIGVARAARAAVVRAPGETQTVYSGTKAFGHIRAGRAVRRAKRAGIRKDRSWSDHAWQEWRKRRGTTKRKWSSAEWKQWQ